MTRVNEMPGPSTVTEALVAEMLGDIGLLHEQIEALPDALQKSLAPSLGSIAQVLKEAKAAIDEYTGAQKLTIQQSVATEKAILREAMKSEAGEILADAVRSLQASAQAHEASIRANQRQGTSLVLVVILTALLSSGVGIAGSYLLFGQAQAVQAELGRATSSVWQSLDAKTRERIQKARQG